MQIQTNQIIASPTILQQKLDFNWQLHVPFALMHVAALGAFFIPFEWQWFWLCVGTYYFKMFGITAGYHRYFSHKTFKTSRIFQFVLALIGIISFQKGPLWWAAHHRTHHKYSGLEGDVHAPEQKGFVWAHLGWIFKPENDITQFHLIRDFAKYPELRWLNRYHLVPGIAFAFLLFAWGGWPAVIWGFCVSFVASSHCTFLVNSVCHIFGQRRYQTKDNSRNNWWVAILTLGEGWHNNHHYYQNSARQGFYWWEYDASYYILKMLSWMGIVWDLKEPPAWVYERNLVETAVA